VADNPGVQAMNGDPLRKLGVVSALMLAAACLPVFSQTRSSSDAATIRVGVAMLRTGAKDISDTEVRDHLIKVLGRRKTGKNAPVLLVPVAIDLLPGTVALAEAREKSCEFVLYLHLKLLETTQKADPNNFNFNGIPVTDATLEYLVKRVSDGAYASGTVKGEDESIKEAILRATEKVGIEAVASVENPVTLHAAEFESASAPAVKLNTQIFIPANFCDWLPGSISHVGALRGVCRYAVTLPQKMPNFVCEQMTSRFIGENRVPTDLIVANVRYEDGNETYSEIKLNGKPAPDAISNTSGLWATGVFEGNLKNIFDPENEPKFEFAGQTTMGDRVAWIFTYSIAEQKHRLWQLRAEDQVTAPSYEGEIWVDQESGAVVRFRSTAVGIPSGFPIERAELMIDYRDVQFADGTAFVLPASSTTATKYQSQDATRNVVKFEGCHKFRAKTRILDVAGNSVESEPVAAVSIDAVRDELEQNQTIYDIQCEQAIREDAVRLAMEHKLDMDLATVRVLRKLGALQRERQNLMARETASKPPAQTAGNESLPVIKVRVNLVPVSVVTRDSAGRAVGTLIKDNFRLFDERRVQSISRFSVEKGSEAPVIPGEQTAPKEATPPPAAVASSRQPMENNIAYVFDDLHATREDLQSAKEAAARYLANLRPEDRVALFTTSGEIGLTFTAGREKFQAALKELKAHPTPGWNCPPMDYYQANQIVNHSDPDASGVAVQDAIACAHAGTGQLAERLATSRALEVAVSGRVASEHSLAILNEVIARMAAVPGRRTIVLVSPGFLAVDPGAQDRAMAVIDRAVQAGIVVNTLDVGGVPSTGVDVTNAGDSLAHLDLDRQDATARNELMADLAYGTGGTFFHNNNDMNEGFRRTSEVPEYIYVLGFSPQKLDGKFHRLKVALNTREKLSVQARPGYYAVRPEATE